MLGFSDSNQRSKMFCHVDSFVAFWENILSVAKAVFGLFQVLYRVSIFICTMCQKMSQFFHLFQIRHPFFLCPDQWGVKVVCWIFVSPFQDRMAIFVRWVKLHLLTYSRDPPCFGQILYAKRGQVLKRFRESCDICLIPIALSPVHIENVLCYKGKDRGSKMHHQTRLYLGGWRVFGWQMRVRRPPSFEALYFNSESVSFRMHAPLYLFKQLPAMFPKLTISLVLPSRVSSQTDLDQGARTMVYIHSYSRITSTCSGKYGVDCRTCR